MRYTTSAMTEIWSDENRTRLWCEIECLVLEAQAALGEIPAAWGQQARKTPPPTQRQIAALELTSKHEVVAFLDAWNLDHAHIGMTSSDLVDTALHYRLMQTSQHLLEASAEWVRTLAKFSLEHKATYRVGRTHGQDATEDTLGHRFADFTLMAARAHRRLHQATPDIATCKISGATGTYSDISPEVEAYVGRKLHLTPAQSATQIIARDSLVAWASAVANLVDIIAAVALEIRLMSHSAIAETTPPKTKGQKGSSAMPHKTNPILAEQLTGLARLTRACVDPIADGVYQWHERDLAHSSVERIAVPQLSSIAHYALLRGVYLVETLQPNQLGMRERLLESRGLLASHRLLAALQKNGTARKVAHDMVEEVCALVRSGRKQNLLQAMNGSVLPDTWADESINLDPLWVTMELHSTFGLSTQD